MLAAYRRDGQVVVPGVVDDATVLRLLGHLEESYVADNGLAALSVERDPGAAAIAADDRLVRIARLVLDAEPISFGATFLVKSAGGGLPVLWHQDGEPWRRQFGIEAAVTLWVALDPADPSSGGMRVIPGSQHLGLRPLRPADDPPNVFGWESEPEMVDEGRAVAVVLAPGDVSVHHPAVLHCSGPNTSDRRRAALALRYRAD